MANEIARQLRQGATTAERLLWDELRELRSQGYHFRRQAPLEDYIVDFACYAQRLIVEIDGVQHGDPDHARRDSNRDARLRSLGFNVLRYSNSDVMEKRDGVVLEILAALGASVGQD